MRFTAFKVHLMKPNAIPLSVLVLSAAFAGAGQAATVPVGQSLSLFSPQGDLIYNIATAGGATGAAKYYELVVQPSWVQPTKFTTFSTEPLGSVATYSLFADLNAAIGAGDTGALLSTWTVTDLSADNQNPFYMSLVSAGQYILQIDTTPRQYSISTNISSVPLPAAALLFGTALLGFFGLGSRKQKLA
jgi:hypothetical protein